MEYHTNDNHKLGHAFSLIAISIFYAKDEDMEFSTGNMELIAEGCRVMVKKFNSVQKMETLLKKEASYVNNQIKKMLQKIFPEVKKAIDTDEDTKARVKKLRGTVADRSKNILSDEYIIADSDAEDWEKGDDLIKDETNDEIEDDPEASSAGVWKKRQGEQEEGPNKRPKTS